MQKQYFYVAQGVEIWNVVSRLVLLHMKKRRNSILQLLFSMEGIKLELEMRHQVLMDFYQQNLVRENT